MQSDAFGTQLTQRAPPDSVVADATNPRRGPTKAGDPARDVALSAAASRGDESRRAVARLAALPNVTVKLSGLLTEAAPDMRVFGSDWPVLNLGGCLTQWVDVVAEALAGLTSEEAQSVWSGTVAAQYLARR